MSRSSRLYLCAILPLLMACSVRQEPLLPEHSQTEVILTATVEGSSPTRTGLDEDYSTILWMPHETISVFCDGQMRKFTSVNDERVSFTSFKGMLPVFEKERPPLYGLYPYDAEATFSDGSITTCLPAGQTAVAGTFADKLFISVGRTESLEMGFYNICTGLRFMLDREGIQRVTFLANGGESLAGPVSIGLDEKEISARPLEHGASEVTLTAPDGTAFLPSTWYYLVTLPAAMEQGYTILLEGDNVFGAARSSQPIRFSRNKFRYAELDASRVYFPAESDRDIENSGVRSFLENVDYSDDPSYTRSEVSNYQGSDKPEPVTLYWEGKAAALLLSTAPDLSSARKISVSYAPASIYNLIPGVRYFYSVLAEDGTVLKESCIIPKGPMRMIYGLLKNSRDLGGWKAGDKTIRYGKLYRGAKLDDVQSNPEEKDIVLNQLGIGVDLDLRGLPPGSQGGSGEMNPWSSSDPIIYKNIQLWNYFVASSNKNMKLEKAPGKSADQYQYAIRCIIEWLRAGKVVYFHCHGGADRTGTLAFLLEALLGVSESDLAKDFELTTYSNSVHRRNSDGGWFYKPMVYYIREFDPKGTIQDQVTAWAKTRHSDKVDPLTDKEIQELKDLMLE
ncbi:MAG: tyrosine-protein phosphatase [Bacteroidales bacterium]|nr:tyrosine-protein phosphatase [Bacteroidales bacterium]